MFPCDCGLRLKITTYEWNKWATFYVIIVSHLDFMAYGILFTWRRRNFFHFHKQYSKFAYVITDQILGEDCSHNRGEESYDWQGRIVSNRKKSTPLPPRPLCLYEPPWNWTQILEVSQRTAIRDLRFDHINIRTGWRKESHRTTTVLK
jgi:hypothetical protein